MIIKGTGIILAYSVKIIGGNRTGLYSAMNPATDSGSASGGS